MILVTGGTGFVGKALIRRLVEMKEPVRVLIRPSTRSPDLPRGTPVEVAVCSLKDERGLRAAMVGVDTIYHLVSGERRGTRANLMETDIQGTRAVVQAAANADVNRFFYLSHLGADRASAYPVLKTKAIAEEYLRRSGLNYTILRSAVVYGQGDALTTGLASLMSAMPFIFLVPASSRPVMLQPIWVDDLATCLVWALEQPETMNRMIEVGGPEYLTIQQIAELVMKSTGIRRQVRMVSFPLLRYLTMVLEGVFPHSPISAYWLDYLASNRTCSLDSAPRVFNLMPARMSHRLAYLARQDWRGTLIRTLLRSR